jgi:hypothetical protein
MEARSSWHLCQILRVRLLLVERLKKEKKSNSDDDNSHL